MTVRPLSNRNGAFGKIAPLFCRRVPTVYRRSPKVDEAVVSRHISKAMALVGKGITFIPAGAEVPGLIAVKDGEPDRIYMNDQFTAFYDYVNNPIKPYCQNPLQWGPRQLSRTQAKTIFWKMVLHELVHIAQNGRNAAVAAAFPEARRLGAWLLARAAMISAVAPDLEEIEVLFRKFHYEVQAYRISGTPSVVGEAIWLSCAMHIERIKHSHGACAHIQKIHCYEDLVNWARWWRTLDFAQGVNQQGFDRAAKPTLAKRGLRRLLNCFDALIAMPNLMRAQQQFFGPLKES